MYKDGGPKHNLGFGIPIWGSPDVEEGLPESGGSNAVQRALQGKPALSFFATATASLVAMHVAGKVVKGAGVRLTSEAQRLSRQQTKIGQSINSGFKSFRKIQAEFDALEGVSRKLVDPNDPTLFVKRSPDGRGWLKDSVTQTDGFHFRHDNPNVPDWVLRDEIQQRLVKQARRLPYELPGFYAADKLLIDPLFGNDQERKVNWSNPFDVIGDFAHESVKNVGLNVLPFEVGTGAVKQGYRKAISNIANNPTNAPGLAGLKSSLELVGADATDLINRAFRFSHQSTGAFSQLVRDASESGLSLSQFYKQHGSAAIPKTKPGLANASYSRRLFEQAKDVFSNRDLGRQALDTMPGPFKGMGTALSMYKQNFKTIGRTYDDWQDVISGRTSVQRLSVKSSERAQNVQAFMRKGGGTYLEQFAAASHRLGMHGPSLPDGKVNPDWKNGEFYRHRSQNVYNAQLIKALSETTGLSEEAASKFVRMSHHITPFAGGRTPYPEGENLMGRIQFSSKQTHTNNINDWWKSVVRGVSRHGIPFNKDQFTIDGFQQAVKRADLSYGNSAFKELMDEDIATQWRHLHGQVLPQFAAKSLPSGKLPYDNFSNAALGSDSTRQFLLKRTAQRLGINTVDNAGNVIPLDQLKSQIREYGLNPNDPFKLRGYLVTQKDINVPWARGRGNVFGVRSMSLQEAVDNDYFAGSNDAVRKEISYLVNQKTFRDNVGRGGNLYTHINEQRHAAQLGRVYVNASGNVLDLGRLRRSVTAATDTFASDYQIPLLHFNPLQLGFYKKYQQMRNASPINIVSANSLQPGMVLGEKADFYTLVKTSARSSKAKVVAVKGNSLSGVESNILKGTFRPTLTNASSIGGRYSRLFMGETGVPSSQSYDVDPNNPNKKRLLINRLKKGFDVSNDQRDSLFFGQNSVLNRAIRATRRNADGRRRSLANPNRLAEAISKPGFFGLDANASEGFDNLVDSLRNYDFSTRTLKQLIDKNPQLKRAFAGVLDGVLPPRPPGVAPLSVFDIADDDLPDIIKNIIKRDNEIVFAGKSDRARIAARRSQNNLKALLGQGDRQNQFWGLPAPNKARSAGISRRIDQLRNEFLDYLVATTDERVEGVGIGFAGTVRSLLGDVDDLFTKGRISAVERTEARTAILSLQVERARNETFSLFDETNPYNILDHNRATLSTLMQPRSNYVQIQQLMGEVGSFKAQDGGFFRRNVTQRLKNLGAADPYSIEDEVNPFGSSIVFEPTFGTAFANNPLRATMGVAGLSWHQEALSGAAMPATHLVMRLNKYFETFGVGIDATRYKSPVDLFARGMVLKRVAPVYAVGATAFSADASLGGLLNDRDEEGNRVYSPFFMGLGADVIAQGQIAGAGLVPGGQTGEEKREELFEGQVPIRSGRYWALGNTPWKGGRIQYFRPSWYQRFKAGGSFIPEMNETPMERLAFGYDFSPLRVLDPYRFERQNAETRPYPVSGDYFTGPYGPITPLLNSTIGRVLKPRKQMVSDENLQYLMQQYAPVGDSGAYFSQTPILDDPMSRVNAGYMQAGIGTGSANVLYPSMGYALPRGRASAEVRGRTEAMAAMYSEAANRPGSYVDVYDSLVPYGVPQIRGTMSPRVISAQPPVEYGGVNNQLRRLGYASQEMAGIYGFGFSSIRSRLGFGSQDLMPEQAMLEPASMGYSSGRAFWNLNLGGMGDLPLPIEGQFANLEISEFVRRFVPREPSADYLNPLPNELGRRYPWLPGADYPLAPVKTGDPYTRIPDATIRLPGTGFNRTNMTFGSSNNMSVANVHQILGDIAPWSQEYRAANSLAANTSLSPMEQALINRTRYQVEAKRIENEFIPYEYKYQTPLEAGQHPFSFTVGRFGEWLSHRDTYFNRKFLPITTAVEDWERDNVYGATYPQWQTPIESFLKPMFYKATQRDPITAPLGLGAVGSLFGVSPQAKLFGSTIGGAIGLGASLYGKAYEGITGNRYIPARRKQELALEEYVDILSYIKSTRNASVAAQMGDTQASQFFMQQTKRTMFGADFNQTPEQLAMALPARKREHFRAMLYAPPQEREQILSTAGRLERRFYQAAWGMEVEERPDLQEYFQDHELPPMDSQFWDPNIDMDTIKVKIGQSLGLDMSQMGYFPQQIREANLVNPVYPNMLGQGPGNRSSILTQLQRMIYQNGGNGNVQVIHTPFGDNRVQLNAGMF